MQVLTKVALGALFNRTPDGVHLITRSKHDEYLSSQFLGDESVWDSSYLHYNHGNPAEITAWLKTFSIYKSFNDNVDFAMAAVIELITNFRVPAERKFFNHGDSVFKRAFHRSAYETNSEGVFLIPLRGDTTTFDEGTFEYRMYPMGMVLDHKELNLYVSTTEQGLDVFNSPITLSHQMDLHIPFAEAESEEEIEILSDVGLEIFGEPAETDECCVITKFKMDDLGSEACQAAIISGISGSCCFRPVGKIRQRRVEVINDSYFVYITVNDKLALAVKVEASDFVIGDGIVDDVISIAAHYISQ